MIVLKKNSTKIIHCKSLSESEIYVWNYFLFFRKLRSNTKVSNLFRVKILSKLLPLIKEASHVTLNKKFHSNNDWISGCPFEVTIFQIYCFKTFNQTYNASHTYTMIYNMTILLCVIVRFRWIMGWIIIYSMSHFCSHSQFSSS